MSEDTTSRWSLWLRAYRAEVARLGDVAAAHRAQKPRAFDPFRLREYDPSQCPHTSVYDPESGEGSLHLVLASGRIFCHECLSDPKAPLLPEPTRTPEEEQAEIDAFVADARAKRSRPRGPQVDHEEPGAWRTDDEATGMCPFGPVPNIEALRQVAIRGAPEPYPRIAIARWDRAERHAFHARELARGRKPTP